ncbi:zinc finger protein 322A [Culex quinquefasciatus]|uniref:Zinc finger protein 322A n=1 Tax=Culex quinquefasciatus TaxID=7176 RepID=B0XJP7_CULQU|nr:zinc finger protein 322A [Culex quinquefasciatus]|eukprot:XP_001869869.1 zinc finger protein 322A [Culex quinquefasciatus]
MDLPEALDMARAASLCRVCLKDAGEDMVPVSYEVDGISIVELIGACSGVEVNDEDASLPTNCCDRCVEALYVAHSIAEQCRESDRKLRSLLDSAKDCRMEEDSENLAEDFSDCSQDESEESEHDSGEDNAQDAGVEENLEGQEGPANLEEPNTTCCACRTDLKRFSAIRARSTSETSLIAQRWQWDAIRTVGGRPVDHRCCGCRKDFGTEEELRQHSLSVHGPSRTNDETRPFECELCFKRYSCKNSLGRHFKARLLESVPRTVRKLGANQCCGCRVKFANKEQLVQHSKLVHEPDRSDNLGELKPFECEICFSRYSTREAFKRHKSGFRAEQLYRCEQCDKSFVKRVMLRIHEQKFHDGVQNEVIGAYQCTKCGKTFMHPSSLTNHEKWHNQSRDFECSICQKVFLSKGNLQTHMKLHSPAHQRKAQYECPICRCSFKTPNYLQIHARVHTGEKPHRCTYCSKQFAHMPGLKRHLLTHTEEKQFSCRYCAREFSARPNLLIHEKSHGTEREKCDICGKEFVHVRYLRKHRKRHFKH